ncbi:DUF4956 domain-containing protein [Parvicella tangerina]|uniref:DUF4956 domain-containing protein n=1 Tax=Parvicella tangerina TaxID=2829795 RepID=A0A916JKW0_9FLAO|nr:DUF4956 domain-containing protein [Parvicella tangerina]CAG5079570.1 hypothetical protein CRYO30217_00978 [Parvicella tangerina]
MKINWFDEDVYKLLMRLAINFVFITIIVRFFYYKITKRKDYLFTYYLMGFIIFFICFSLKKLDIDTGMGLGLFAIFSIIRYRTNQIAIKEMTYLFIVIGLSVVNSLASNKISMTELAIINLFMLVLIYVLEYVWLLKHETRKTILFENIKLIDIRKEEQLKEELENRTGLSINRVEIGKINYLDDTAQVRIFYYDDEQGFSDYNELAE